MVKGQICADIDNDDTSRSPVTLVTEIPLGYVEAFGERVSALDLTLFQIRRRMPCQWTGTSSLVQ